MESPVHPIATPPAAGDWLPPDAAFTPAETSRLFEVDSPLLRSNPYALSGPSNTQRARRSDWRVFLTFCAERQFLPLPAPPGVVAAFIEAMSTPTPIRPARAVATLERYVSTIAHAHALAELPDPTRTAYVKGAYRQYMRDFRFWDQPISPIEPTWTGESAEPQATMFIRLCLRLQVFVP